MKRTNLRSRERGQCDCSEGPANFRLPVLRLLRKRSQLGGAIANRIGRPPAGCDQAGMTAGGQSAQERRADLEPREHTALQPSRRGSEPHGGAQRRIAEGMDDRSAHWDEAPGQVEGEQKIARQAGDLGVAVRVTELRCLVGAAIGLEGVVISGISTTPISLRERGGRSSRRRAPSLSSAGARSGRASAPVRLRRWSARRPCRRWKSGSARAFR